MDEPVVQRGIYAALYAFTSEGPEELPLETGQHVLVLGAVCQGWVLARLLLQPGSAGEHAESEGLVPLNYLEWISDEAELPSPSETEHQRFVSPVKSVIVTLADIHL